MTNYPDQYDDNVSLPPASGDDATSVNNSIQAIEAIEHELGLVPSGVYATVRTRLDILEARINNPFAPAPNVTNPFYIGGSPISGVSIQVGFGDPTINLPPAIPGSLYLREDGYTTQAIYAFRPDGYWSLIGSGGTDFTAGGDLSGNNSTQDIVHITGTGGVIPFAATLEGDSAYNSDTGYPLSFSVSNISMGTDADLTLNNMQLISPILRITSSVSLTATRNIVLPPAIGATYWVYNGTLGGQSLQFIAHSGTGITVPNGLKTTIYFDGTNYVTAGIVVGGDLSATTNISQTVIKINGTSIPASPSANQVLVATSGTNATWEQISNSQIASGAAITVNKLAAGTSAQVLLNNATPTPTWTTITGDVALTNAGVTTVTALQGKTVSSGSLTEGQFLVASSTSNWAPTSLSGDLSESATTPGKVSVVSLTGSSGTINIASTGNVITWAAATTAPGVTQTAAAPTSGGSGAAGATLSIVGQAGQAATGASNNGGNGANIVIEAGTGGTSGSASAGANGNIYLVTGSATQGLQVNYGVAASGYGSITLGSNTASSSNYALATNSGNTYLNGTSSSGLAINGSQQLVASSGVLTVTPAQIAWKNSTVSPNIIQSAQATDVSTNTLTIQAQGAYTSASTHTSGGTLILEGGTSTAAGTGVGGLVEIASGLQLKTFTVATSTYTVDTNATLGDIVLLVSYSSTGACTVTLPTQVSGRTVIVKDSGGSAATSGHNITISPASGTIDGASSYVLNLNYASVMLVSNGTNWFVASAYNGTVI